MPKLTRLPNWPARLERFLVENGKREFCYGTWDCCLFAGGAIEAITGVHPAPWLAGSYTDELGALGRVSSYLGYKEALLSVADAVGAIADTMDMPPQSALLARRGDLVVLQQGAITPCGIVALNGTDIMALTNSGMTRVKLFGSSGMSWRVG